MWVEIIIGNTVFANDGSVKWVGNGGKGLLHACVADINLDGFSEVIAGNTVYRHTGEILWENTSVGDGYTAIGNFDSDPEAEIVVTHNTLTVLEHDGSIKWAVNNVGSGAPIIADFDGDTKPEIGVAGSSFYTVCETNGVIKWRHPIHDQSSGITGSSVFDFENDGKAEVVFADEDSFMILSGTDGTTLYAIAHDSHTGMEMPIIADVDNDGSAEIVVVENGRIDGIRVIGDRDNTWAPARPIWNQYSYHITNVNDDGSIPQFEEASWLKYNSYRQNKTNFEPTCYDIAVAQINVDGSRCPDSSVVIVKLHNAGDQPIFNLPVTLYIYKQTDTAKLVTKVDNYIESGKNVEIKFTVGIPENSEITLRAVADDYGDGIWRIREKDKANNSLQISVNLCNRPPIITSQVPGSAGEGILYNYQIFATDPDNDSIIYRLLRAPAGMEIDTLSGMISWIPGPAQQGIHNVKVIICDKHGGYDNQEYNINVGNYINSIPLIISKADRYVELGKSYYYQITATDKDGDPLNYSIVNGPMHMDVSTCGLITWHPTSVQTGENHVEIEVFDEKGGIVRQQFAVNVYDGQNVFPEIVSVPEKLVSEGIVYTYTVMAHDSDNDVLHYSLIQHPAGMIIDSISGNVSWVPTVTHAGVYRIHCLVTDGKGGYAEQIYQLTVINAENNLPSFESTPLTTATTGVLYKYQLVVADPDSDQITISLQTAPAGMTINPQTLLISWMPLVSQAGDNQIVISIDDGYGQSVLQTYTVNVAEGTNTPPQFHSVPNWLAAVVGEQYLYQLQVYDQNGDPIQVAFVNRPANMNIDPQSLLIAWVPKRVQCGENFVKIKLDDGNGGITEQEFTLIVSGELNHLPEILSQPDTNVYQNKDYSYTPNFMDKDGDSLHYALVTAPSGMYTNDIGAIVWVPDNSHVGSHLAVMVVTDGYDTVSQTFTVHVFNVNDTPVIVSQPFEYVFAGLNYSYPVVAVDPDGDSIFYTLIEAPAGMTITDKGLITWPDNVNRHNSHVAVQVSDSAGAKVNQEWDMVVLPDTVPPVITIQTSATTAYPGDSVAITVLASDNLEVAALEFMIDSTFVQLNQNGCYILHTSIEDTIALIANATDINGNSITAHATIIVDADADTDPPEVTISYSPQAPSVGDLVTFTVNAIDKSLDREMVWLTIDGKNIPLDEQCRADWFAVRRGSFEVIATAYDSSSRYGADSIDLIVNSTLTDSTPPVATVLTPEHDTAITGIIELFGSATDDNFAYYTLSYRDINNEQFTEYTRNTQSCTNAKLGVFDGTGVDNGIYIVRLTAYDIAGNTNTEEIVLHVEGQKKIGQFKCDFFI